MFPPAPKEILAARQTAREAAQALLTLLLTPREHLRAIPAGLKDNGALQYIVHFDLASAVPPDRAVPFSKIAAQAELDEAQCKRILRFAMTQGFFHEPEMGLVAHTSSSVLLRDPITRDTLRYITEDSGPASLRLVENVEKYGASEEMNETAWNLAHGTDLPQFQFFEKHPKRGRRFWQAMRYMGRTEGFNIKHLVSGFDWSQLSEGSTVVDVGGSLGHASIAIAVATKKPKCVVQDLPKIIEGANTEEVPEEVKGRIDFMTHAFFSPQPIKGADVYLLRFIMHNYSDKYASKILKNIVPAMGKSSRLIIMDGVMPAPGSVPKAEERSVRYVRYVLGYGPA